MSTAAEQVLQQADKLSPNELHDVGMALLQRYQEATQITTEEKDQINAVLLDRVDGPFIPLEDDFFQRIGERAISEANASR